MARIATEKQETHLSAMRLFVGVAKRVKVIIMYCVYKHTLPNGKVYVGITSQKPSRRWRSGEGYKKNKHFYYAIKKYGWDSVKSEVLYSDLTEEDACAKEIELIARTRSWDRNFGYNFTLGGEAYSFTEDVKEKLRANHPHTSRAHTEDEKLKISKANKGRKFTEEHKRNIKRCHSHCKTFEGKLHSEESKRKISKNHFRYYGKENPSAREVMCIETGEVFDTITDASKKKNANRTHISSCCTGHRERAGGYHWKYVVKAP